MSGGGLSQPQPSLDATVSRRRALVCATSPFPLTCTPLPPFSFLPSLLQTCLLRLLPPPSSARMYVVCFASDLSR